LIRFRFLFITVFVILLTIIALQYSFGIFVTGAFYSPNIEILTSTSHNACIKKLWQGLQGRGFTITWTYIN